MVVKIAGRSDVCLNACSSIMEYGGIMGLTPSEWRKVTDSSNPVCGGGTPRGFGALGL